MEVVVGDIVPDHKLSEPMDPWSTSVESYIVHAYTQFVVIFGKERYAAEM